MKNVLGLVLAIIWGGGIQLASAQSPSLDYVLEEYAIHSHASDRANLSNVTFEGKMTVAGQDMPLTIYARQKNVHIAYKMGGNQKIKMVHTPDHSWLTSSDAGETTIQYFPGQFFPLVYFMKDMGTTLYMAKAKGNSLLFEGLEDHGDGEQYIVQVSNHKEESVVYYLSPDDFLPRHMKIMVKWQGSHHVVDYYLDEYVKVDGIPFPTRWETLKPDGRPDTILKFETVKVNEKLPASVFRLPKGDLAGPNVPAKGE